MRACLTVGLIDRYLAGNCLADEQDAVKDHLSRCATCRGHVDKLTRVHQTRDSAVIDSNETAAAIHNRADRTRIIVEDRTRTAADIPTVLVTSSVGGTGSETLFPGYEITEELPRGGQAIVYKAIHLATKTQVAIKVLLPTLLASAQARYHFEREAELIASLDHPNIIGIHDSGIIHNQYYFVMHYVDGLSLDEYVQAQDLSLREIVVLFNKVCAAVSYAHQQGIIHRDLKFGNILVDRRGEPHILDFGLAKAINATEHTKPDTVATMTGQWAGTLSTMAPEQTMGKPARIDVRADIYSLGVVLYRLLTGQYPYEVSGSIVEALKRIQEQEPIRPRRLVRKLDSDIEAILLTALAKDPEQRYQSAADMQRDLDNWLQGLPIQIKSVNTWYLMRKIIGKHRFVSTVVGLLMVIILSFTSFSLRLLYSTRKAEQKSATIGKRWEESALDHSVFSGSIAFTYFLQLLHEGNIHMAHWAGGILTKNTKESRAAVFLLNPAPLIEKESDYRQASKEDPVWFKAFIMGEHHHRDGQHQEAIHAYQDSFRALRQMSKAEMSKSDLWLSRNVAAHLYELTGDHQWLDEESPGEENL